MNGPCAVTLLMLATDLHVLRRAGVITGDVWVERAGKPMRRYHLVSVQFTDGSVIVYRVTDTYTTESDEGRLMIAIGSALGWGDETLSPPPPIELGHPRLLLAS